MGGNARERRRQGHPRLSGAPRPGAGVGHGACPYWADQNRATRAHDSEGSPAGSGRTTRGRRRGSAEGPLTMTARRAGPSRRQPAPGRERSGRPAGEPRIPPKARGEWSWDGRPGLQGQRASPVPLAEENHRRRDRGHDSIGAMARESTGGGAARDRGVDRIDGRERRCAGARRWAGRRADPREADASRVTPGPTARPGRSTPRGSTGGGVRSSTALAHRPAT